MLVNIQQPVIQSDGTLLLATDSKVQLQMLCALGDSYSLLHPTSPSFYVLCVSVLENVGSFSAQTRTNTIELLYTLPLFNDTWIVSIDIK